MMIESPFVVAILSGKGGVGKTTISLNLAKALSRSGPVWLIDIDLFNRGATSALWESEKQIPLSVAELILDAERETLERGDEQALAEKFREKLAAAAPSLAYDKRFTFIPAARAVEAKEASYVLWHGMSERGLHGEVFLGALVKACAEITPGSIILLDGHGGLDELSIAAALISDTCYIVNEPDLITFTGSVTLYREIIEQVHQSPQEAWVEFIINRVSPNQPIEKVEAQFGPMLDAMSPAREAVAVYFPLEPELFGVFGQDPFVSELYTRYWFSRKIKFLAERVLEAGRATGKLDEQWAPPKGSKPQPRSVRTALRREWHKRGDLLLIGWLATLDVLLGTWIWQLLSIVQTFSTSPPIYLWIANVLSLGVHAVGTIRWFRVQRHHLANINRLRGQPTRRLRFGDTQSAALREQVESEVKTKKAARPLVVAGCLLAVLLIVIAIGVPNVLTALQRSKQRRTLADMQTIAQAWEARATDVNAYNGAGQSSDVDGRNQEYTWPTVIVPPDTLAEHLAPTYIKKVPLLDGWGKPFIFTTDEAFGSGKAAISYGIQSYGSDGQPDRDIPTKRESTSVFDCDILFTDGTFLKYPEGIQSQ